MSGQDPGRLLGVVLCGGRSRRMGQEKAMLEHPAGGTYWSHAVDRLASLCDDVCLAGSLSVADRVTVHDYTPHTGPAAGVASALRHAAANAFDAILVTPVDMPFLSADDLRGLRHRWHEHHRRIVVGVSMETGRIEPLVAIYPVWFSREINVLADGQDRSLLRWVAATPHLGVPLPPAACQNMNTPEDLRDGPEVSL